MQSELQLALTGVELVEPLLEEKVARRKEASETGRVRRSGLEALGHRLGHVPACGVSSRPSRDQRCDLHPLSHPEPTGTVGTEKTLVTSKAYHIGTVILIAPLEVSGAPPPLSSLQIDSFLKAEDGYVRQRFGQRSLGLLLLPSPSMGVSCTTIVVR